MACRPRAAHQHRPGHQRCPTAAAGGDEEGGIEPLDPNEISWKDFGGLAKNAVAIERNVHGQPTDFALRATSMSVGDALTHARMLIEIARGVMSSEQFDSFICTYAARTAAVAGMDALRRARRAYSTPSVLSLRLHTGRPSDIILVTATARGKGVAAEQHHPGATQQHHLALDPHTDRQRQTLDQPQFRPTVAPLLPHEEVGQERFLPG